MAGRADARSAGDQAAEDLDEHVAQRREHAVIDVLKVNLPRGRENVHARLGRRPVSRSGGAPVRGDDRAGLQPDGLQPGAVPRVSIAHGLPGTGVPDCHGIRCATPAALNHSGLRCRWITTGFSVLRTPCLHRGAVLCGSPSVQRDTLPGPIRGMFTRNARLRSST